MDPRKWIREIFLAAADDFAKRCIDGDKRLTPLSDWEIQRIQEGVQKGIFNIKGSVFQTDNGEKEYKFFGFNREYFTHFAMLVEALSWDLPNGRIEFEYEHLDLMVFDGDTPSIGIEVKKSRKDAEILIAEMNKHLPSPDLNQRDRGLDGLRKLKYLLKIKPKQFWIVAPEARWKFEVTIRDSSIVLIPIESPKILKAA